MKWKGLTISLTALGYDWLYPAWTAAERSTLTTYLVSKGLNSQSNNYSNNIGMINDGGYIMAALAVGTANESVAEPDLAQAVSQLAGKVNQFNANAGAWLETTLSPAITGVNPDHAFRGPTNSSPGGFQEVATLRENWTDTRATFVGGMGGTYMSHGMLQSGTFQLSARGVKWFVDFKSEGYDVPNHGTTTPTRAARIAGTTTAIGRRGIIASSSIRPRTLIASGTPRPRR